MDDCKMGVADMGQVPTDPDDICPKASKPWGRHLPDWTTAHVEVDGGEFYVDVNCKLCGRSGCVGTAKLLVAGINW
jgi:hypothetical protein